MNILILSHKFYPNLGGIESISEMLADEFIKAGRQVRVVTWTIDLTQKNFAFKVIRNPGIRQLFQQYRWADIVLENNPCLRLAWPNFFIQKPRITGLQTWISRVDNRISNIDRIKRIYLSFAITVIACSDSLRKKSYENAIVIGNPYNHISFKNKPDIVRDKAFVFLGRLVSDKGADLAIKALSKLNQTTITGQKYLLTIIGDGEDRIKLENLVKELNLTNQVVFTGAKFGVELVNLLNKHRYILVPSVWEEPFGIVALEGMACGCLPFVSDGGGLPDAVGSAGLTFHRGDEDDLVKVIKQLLDNPLLENQLRGEIQQHLAKHTITVVAKKYLDVIESVAKNR